jgi:hypothetical protein
MGSVVFVVFSCAYLVVALDTDVYWLDDSGLAHGLTKQMWSENNGERWFFGFHNREWVRLAVSNLVLQAVVLASIRIASMCTAFRDSINDTVSLMAFKSRFPHEGKIPKRQNR